MSPLRTRVAVTLLPLLLAAGCRKSGPEPPPKEPETPAAIPASETAAAEPPKAKPVRPKLPTDVFFDAPLSVAGDRRLIAGAAPTSGGPAAVTPAMATTGGDMPAAAPKAEGKAVDWAAVIPAEVLTAEVKRIHDSLAPKLESVAIYNTSYLDFRAPAAELAALAGVATRHPGKIAWKANAKYVRELAAAMLSEQLTRGDKSYKQVKEPFDKIGPLLEGKKPAGLPEADDATDFAVSAEFGGVMKRLEMGETTLKNNGGSESAFEQNAADLAREGRVLAALSDVIADEAYGYGEDPPYQKYAAGMTQAGLDLAAAAQSGDKAKFDLAASALSQSCVQCHGEYRNN